MPRYFTNPFGWDWMPRGEDVYDISTGDMWNFGGGFNSFYDKYEEIKKTAKMWEEIKNVNIKLSFDEDEKHKDQDKVNRYGHNHNQISSLGKDYYINVNPTDERYLTTDAKFEHNLSHIAYDTPLKRSRQEAHRLSLGNGIPETFKDKKYALSADCNLCEEVIRHIYDILEDERVNSLWSDLYIGTSQDYDKCKKKVNQTLKGEPKNPLDALWYSYNGKHFDKQPMSEIADKFIAAVGGTDYPGALQLTKDYFQNVFLPWLIQQKFDDCNKDKQNKSKSESDKSDEKGDKPPQPNEQPEGMPGLNPIDKKALDDLYKSLQKSIKKVRDKHNAFPDHKGMKNDLSAKKEKKLNSQARGERKCDSNGKPVGEFSYKPGLGGGQGKSYDMFDPKKIEELKRKGSERNDFLRKKLVSKGLIHDKTLDAFNFDPEKFDIITRDITEHTYSVDKNTVARLRRVWQRAKGESREITDDEGEDLDIDAYIQEIPSAVKENIVYINERAEPGLHIVYSADCSGSMDGLPLQIVRDVTATIKQSLVYEPKIKMSMIGWGGGHKTGISVHSTMEDINRFTVKDSYGGTPEANALWYSSTWLQRQPEVTKAIFFVSDGAFSEALAKEQVDNARKHGLNVFGIGISDHGLESQYRHIFGAGNYTIVDEDYKQGMSRLINDLSKFISRHIKTVV